MSDCNDNRKGPKGSNIASSILYTIGVDSCENLTDEELEAPEPEDGDVERIIAENTVEATDEAE
jgi:hypothetical protein